MFGQSCPIRVEPMPDVSIVVPCHNGHTFLSRAVESALRQDLESKEVIVVDDGSTAPETLAALERLPRDVQVVRQDNRGLAAARNCGFEAAGSRYVLPLDCDDWIAPDYARKALELIAGREDAFVYSWISAFGAYDAVLRKHWNPFEHLIVNGIAYCLLIPRALWRQVGGYDETMRLGCEDWDFSIRLGSAGAEGLCLPEPALHYRVSAEGMHRTVTRLHYGVIWRGIQKKHPDVYTLSGLLERTRGKTRKGRRYPTWTLLAFWGTHRLLPNALFMSFFRAAVLLRDSLRRSRIGQSAR